MGVLGCVEEDPGREEEPDDPFTWSDTEVRVVLAAMDLTTGEEARDALFAAPLGETVDLESAHWITPGGPTVEGVVPVPGAVVLTGERYIDRVDGPVP